MMSNNDRCFLSSLMCLVGLFVVQGSVLPLVVLGLAFLLLSLVPE